MALLCDSWFIFFGSLPEEILPIFRIWKIGMYYVFKQI